MVTAIAFMLGVPAESAGGSVQVTVQPQTAEADFADLVAGLERHEGFLPYYVDSASDRIYLEIERFDEEFLYITALSAGGMNTGMWWSHWPWTRPTAALVHFEHRGSQVVLIERDGAFLPAGDDDPLGQSVQWAFSPSVVAALPVIAEEAGRVLVDAKDFFLRDAVDVGAHLGSAVGGSARLERQRSRIHAESSRAIADNTEIEALLTFELAGASNGREAWSAIGSSVSVRQRHSLLRLPTAGFLPRKHDTRLGFLFPVRRLDFSRSPTEGYENRWINKWRLEKKDPLASVSEPVEPIVFWVDPAVPARYRDALTYGVAYWRKALREAGFENAIRLEDLPEHADPMDLRYQVVVRWSPAPGVESSYTAWVSDPRTGEIIKSVVYLDAYHDQVNLNRFAALIPALGEAHPTAEEYLAARRRHIVAHEMGHALAGLEHNDIRPSAIGFPAPQVYPARDGTVRLELSQAFHTEVTAYDRWVMRYAYSPTEELSQIVDEGIRAGLLSITDYEVGSSPLTTGRLVGQDRVAELGRAMEVRRALLAHFDERAIDVGEPMQLLLARLMPVYFHHRHAISSVVKAVGGMEYRYASRGDGQTPTQVIDPAVQRHALDRLLSGLTPSELAIPERVIAMIPPIRPGLQVGPPGLLTVGRGNIRYMDGNSGPIVVTSLPGGLLDPAGWARALSEMIIEPLLEPARLARLAAFHSRDPENPSLGEVLERVVDETWRAPDRVGSEYPGLRRVVQRVVLEQLIDLGHGEEATPEVRSVVLLQLDELARDLQSREPEDAEGRAHIAAALRDIARGASG